MAGFGVRRGRFPAFAEDGWVGLPQDWDPRDEGQKPVPGMTGVDRDTSLGVAEKALPCESTTQM